ncbi:MAG: hypothetical protein ACFCBW_06015 [Candidatus Competibacterales bacterium]
MAKPMPASWINRHHTRRVIAPLVLSILLLSILLLMVGKTAGAHPEYLPNEISMVFFINQDTSGIEVMVRTPAYLFENFGLPLRGQDSIDVDAFEGIDPFDPQGRPYTKRAARAVGSAFKILADDEVIDLKVGRVQLAPKNSSAFDGFNAVSAHLKNSPPSVKAEISLYTGFIDIRYFSNTKGNLVFVPTVGPVMAERMKFHLQYFLEGRMVESTTIPGWIKGVNLESTD